MRITLESEAFADFVRLDSLWVETAPLLADRVVGEVALLEQQRPVPLAPKTVQALEWNSA